MSFPEGRARPADHMSWSLVPEIRAASYSQRQLNAMSHQVQKQPESGYPAGFLPAGRNPASATSVNQQRLGTCRPSVRFQKGG
jgi:hypothetical protein